MSPVRQFIDGIFKVSFSRFSEIFKDCERNILSSSLTKSMILIISFKILLAIVDNFKNCTTMMSKLNRILHRPRNIGNSCTSGKPQL